MKPLLLILAIALLADVAAQAASPYVLVGEVRERAGDDAAWADPGFDDSTWTVARSSRVDPQGKILWMRARVDPPAGLERGVPLGLRITMAGSWEAYWNGRFVGRNGRPAAAATAEQIGRLKAELFIPADIVHERGNLLALRVSTHHLPLRLGAPIQGITLSEYGSAADDSLRGGALALLATGPLLLGALYFAVMFALDRRDRASLLLTLLTLAVLAQLLAESVRSFWWYPYPLHIPRIVAILGFAVLTALLLTAYVARQYAPRRMSASLLTLAAALTVIVFTVGGFDGKSALALVAGLLASLALAVVGTAQRRAGAGLTAVALAAVLLVFLTDAASFLDLNYYVAATALLLFLFMRQAVALRAARLRTVQLELELLKQKIQPHFLMNTLTALSEWIESSPSTGVRMIEALAAEFRAVAAMSGERLVPLRQELELCRHHLAVMGFRSKQAYELHTDGVDLEACVPPALLHTLLENALTHNRYVAGAHFTLAESTTGQERTYTLRSPGTGAAGRAGAGGTGHAYVRARLRDAFGERWRFTPAASPDGGWVDTLTVPRGARGD